MILLMDDHRPNPAVLVRRYFVLRLRVPFSRANSQFRGFFPVAKNYRGSNRTTYRSQQRKSFEIASTLITRLRSERLSTRLVCESKNLRTDRCAVSHRSRQSSPPSISQPSTGIRRIELRYWSHRWSWGQPPPGAELRSLSSQEEML